MALASAACSRFEPLHTRSPTYLNYLSEEDLSDKTGQQTGFADTRNSKTKFKNQAAFIERLYQEAGEETADIVANYIGEERFGRAALNFG